MGSLTSTAVVLCGGTSEGTDSEWTLGARDPERSGGQDKGEAPYWNYHMDTTRDFRLLGIRR